MNETETYLMHFIDNLASIGLIRKEAIAEACVGDSNGNGTVVQTIRAKEKVVNKLNGVGAISNSNLSAWCIKRNINIRPKDTLETCLRRGKFSYRERRGNRIYYVKNGVDCPSITLEDIIL